MAVLPNTVPFQNQINGWYCGPAATRVALSARNVKPLPSQSELAASLGTTTNGTDSSNDVVRTLNQYLGAGTYESTFIPGQDATAAQRDELRRDIRASINAGFAVVCNVVGRVVSFEGVPYSYPGGHYVTIVGYDIPDDSVYVADVNTKAYWITTAQLATWVAARGYASRVATVTPPTPPVVEPAPELAPHVLYVDVSNHDRSRKGGPLDWSAMAAAGVGSVMVAKACEGNPTRESEWYDDPWFTEHQAGAVAAGYGLRGAYHVLAREETDDAVLRQVNALRERMDAAGCTFGMVDVEAFPELAEEGRVPDWQTVVRFNDLWLAVERRKLVWYIARRMWAETLGSPDLTRLSGLLASANYPNVKGTTPEAFYGLVRGNSGAGWAAYGGRTPDIWQFGSDAVVSGASEMTDINAYRGTLAELATALAPTPIIPDPEPEPPEYDAASAAYRDYVTAWRVAAIVDMAETVEVPAFSYGDRTWPAVSEPNLLAAAVRATGNDATVDVSGESVSAIASATVALLHTDPEGDGLDH